MRNFVLCLRTVIDPSLGEYGFDDILKEVSMQLRLANDPKKLNAMMTANMAIEKNPLLKVMPLSIKNIGVTVSFLITGEQTTSTLISNLGLIKLPEEMEPYIEKIMFSTGPGKLNGARCGVISFQNKLVVTFANVYEENDIEREFFTRLVKSGVHVKIESNRL
ncbi:MAG: hypothetical protein MJ177_09840 [Clostridia bacterium]|nr:hypothetical protein [Clostridia bacterium]